MTPTSITDPGAVTIVPSGIVGSKQAGETVRERSRLGQQAHDEKGFVRHVEEVAWVHEHVLPLEQVEHNRLLTPPGGHPQQCGPAALDWQQIARTSADWTPLIPNTRWADPLDGRTPRLTR